MNPSSQQFWILCQLFIDFLMVILMIYCLRKLKTALKREASEKSVDQITQLIEPMLAEADSVAKAFEGQILEKSNLIKRLNENLDQRILRLNLLLKRMDNILTREPIPSQTPPLKEIEAQATDKIPLSAPPLTEDHIYDQQETIFRLYNEGHDSEYIAQKLTIPTGEVDLVLNLKKKFLQLEQKA